MKRLAGPICQPRNLPDGRFQRRFFRRRVVGLGRGPGRGRGPGLMGGMNATVSTVIREMSLYSRSNVKRVFSICPSRELENLSFRGGDYDCSRRLKTKIVYGISSRMLAGFSGLNRKS